MSGGVSMRGWADARVVRKGYSVYDTMEGIHRVRTRGREREFEMYLFACCPRCGWWAIELEICGPRGGTYGYRQLLSCRCALQSEEPFYGDTLYGEVLDAAGPRPGEGRIR